MSISVNRFSHLFTNYKCLNMKRMILLFCFTIAINSGFAQLEKTEIPPSIKIGAAKRGFISIAQLEYFLSGTDTVYMISFNNLKYTTIKDFQTLHFKETGGVLNSLYRLLSESMDAEKGKEATFKLGKEEILVKSSRMMGGKYIYFYIVNKEAYFNITKKELDQLFNRK